MPRQYRVRSAATRRARPARTPFTPEPSQPGPLQPGEEEYLTPYTREEIRLPLELREFRAIAVSHDGIQVQSYDDQVDPDGEVIKFSPEEEMEFVRHTPAGYTGERVLLETLREEDLVTALADETYGFAQDNLQQNKDLWKKVFRSHGISGLAREVMREEINARFSNSAVTLNARDLEWTARVMEDILRSTFPRLLHSVLSGNLAINRRNDPVLATILDKLWKQSNNQPGIYHQQFVDERGYSATPNQILRAVEVMLQYAKSADSHHEQLADIEPLSDLLANRIDNIKSPAVPMAASTRRPFPYRKYLWLKAYTKKKTLQAGEFILPRRGAADPEADPELEPEQDVRNKSKDTCITRLCPGHVDVTIVLAQALRRRAEAVPEEDRTSPSSTHSSKSAIPTAEFLA